AGLAAAFAIGTAVLAARGATPSPFERRCIPAGCVAPPSNIPDILSRRALPAGRLAILGATMDLHHGLLAGPMFSDRVPKELATNRLTALVAAARAQGRPVLDLTVTNPTRARFEYPADLLGPLADPEALR